MTKFTQAKLEEIFADAQRSFRVIGGFPAHTSFKEADFSGLAFYAVTMAGFRFERCVFDSANLNYTNFCGASFADCSFRDVSAYVANFRHASLHDCDFTSADLRSTNLAKVTFNRCILTDARVFDAQFDGATFRQTNLAAVEDGEGIVARTVIVPEGTIVGWKKCSAERIVKLTIPADAKRSNATGRKCRASHAIVDAVFDMNGNPRNMALSMFDGTTKYIPGHSVYPDAFHNDRFEECAGGIHFFLTREEAERYS